MKNANFILPGMYEHYLLNLRFIKSQEEFPDYFYPEAKIHSVYGNFQFCIFDGGRIFNDFRQTNKEEMEDIVESYNSKGVAVRLIFSNPVITQEYFQNRFGQAILKACNNSMNEIVVNNKEFELYLRQEYPLFNFVSSTTKCLNAEDTGNEIKQDYSMVCLDYNLNKNWDLLNKFSEEEKAKAEFLCNAICPPKCPFRKNHYKLNGLFYLSYGKPYNIQNCLISENTLYPATYFKYNNISPEEIYGKYLENNFVNFKLEGRSLGAVENICNYVKYMVKPEYQLFILSYVLEENVDRKVFNYNL